MHTLERQLIKSPNLNFLTLFALIQPSNYLIYSHIMQIIFCLLAFIFAAVIPTQSTELKIISKPTPQHYKSLNLLRSLRKYRKKSITFNQLTYSCYTAIKENIKSPNNTNKQNRSIYKVDEKAFEEDLKLLVDDIGVTYHTHQFQYVYKHDTIVSQVDSLITKQMNGKKKFQNFTLGITDQTVSNLEPEHKLNPKTPKTKTPQLKKPSANANIGVKTLYINEKGEIVQEEVPKTQSDGPDMPNQKNDILHNYHPLAYKAVEEGKIKFTIDYEKSLIRTSIPLIPYQINSSMVYNINCSLQLQEPGKKDQNGVGLVLSNFEILYLGNLSLCKSVNSVQAVNRWTIDFGEKIGFFQNKIFGKIQKFCDFEENQFVRRETQLLLQIVPHKDAYIKKMHYIVQIKDILGQNLYQISQYLNFDDKIISCSLLSPLNYVYFTGLLPFQDPQMQENNNTDIFRSILQQKPNIIQMEYVNSKMVKIITSDISKQIYAGKQMVCLISFNTLPDVWETTEVVIILGKQFHADYRFAYFQLNQEYSNYFQNFQSFQKMFQIFPTFICMKGKLNKQKISQQQKSDTLLKKTAADSPNTLDFTQSQNKNNLYYITLSEDGVIEMTTQYEKIEERQEQIQKVQDERQHKQNVRTLIRKKYFFTHDKMYLSETKIVNGIRYKREARENVYYQNNTCSNMIIIHKRGIWRASDLIKFPRFVMDQQEVIKIVKVKFGYAFIRYHQVDQAENDMYAVSSTNFMMHEGYGPFKRPSESLATHKRLKLGTYCGGDIKKNRETDVKIRCGQSWLQIKNVKEVSPCSYEIEVQSQYLCVEREKSIQTNKQFEIFSGSLCVI